MPTIIIRLLQPNKKGALPLRLCCQTVLTVRDVKLQYLLTLIADAITLLLAATNESKKSYVNNLIPDVSITSHNIEYGSQYGFKAILWDKIVQYVT